VVQEPVILTSSSVGLSVLIVPAGERLEHQGTSFVSSGSPDLIVILIKLAAYFYLFQVDLNTIKLRNHILLPLHPLHLHCQMARKTKQTHEMFFANSMLENGFVNTIVVCLDITEGLKPHLV
jgi:hypothetical protein